MNSRMPSPINHVESERWQRRRRRGVEAAQDLRARSTPAEAHLWQFLRRDQLQGLGFRRQHPIHGFVVDFVCANSKLIVEIDGPVHEQQVEDDARRSAYIETLGYRIIRFTNEEVLENTDNVLQRIASVAALPLSCDAGEGAGGRGLSAGGEGLLSAEQQL